MKATIKQIIYKLGLSRLLDYTLFKYRYYTNKSQNRQYQQKNPTIAFPPDYYLYETFQLNYEQYIEDGILSAKEIFEWTEKYLPNININILEWGCGVARTCRHLHNFFDNSTKVFACDINREMINWNASNINNIEFALIDYLPPTHYKANSFDLVFGISVFTHIDISQQKNWLQEIHRILNTNGVFLFSTHGNRYFARLSNVEQKVLETDGAVTKQYYKRGHRLMSTYNDAGKFKKLVEKYFTILEYYDGEKHLDKVGGQDMWIVKKKL